ECLDTMPLLVTFGNPLLDITAVVSNQNLHLKYGFPVDGQLEVNEAQRQIFNEIIENYEIESTAGGCALNSSRVFSWVLGEQERVLFVGGIGKDQQAEKLRSIVNKSGVKANFVEIESHPTGMCVALVLDSYRCLCADIGAANICEPHHIFNSQMMPALQASKFIYVEGYFITHSFDTALQLARFAQEHKKIFIFNLCGSYVCESHPNELAEIIPYVDILFGYIEEYKTFDKFVNIQELSNTHKKDDYNVTHSLLKMLKAVNGEEDITKCDKKISDKEILSKDSSLHNGLTNGASNGLTNGSTNGHEHNHVNGNSSNESVGLFESTMNNMGDFPSKKEFDKQHKIVIVTTGPSPLLYIEDSGLVREHSVPPIPPQDIIDTTGAGDSFVGGYLAALSLNCTVEQCLDCGIWSAQQILKQKGCTLPQWKARFLK
ncbi:unnamed protein product, partial [Meganyctiphanes norvegica]